MSVLRRHLLGAVGAGAVLPLSGGRAQTGNQPILRIGVMSDQSGPYSGGAGATSVACTRQAIEESPPPTPASGPRCWSAIIKTRRMSAPTSPGSGSTATAWM
ncbi:hypothetical protein ACFQU2_05335 [Siccirubricoccus deserti]